MEKKTKKTLLITNISIAVLLLLTTLTIIYLATQSDKKKDDVVSDKEIYQVKEVMDSYFKAMNEYGAKNPKKIAEKYFTTTFQETIDFEGMQSSLEETAETYATTVDKIEFTNEITEIKYSDVYDEYYVFVTEGIKIEKMKDTVEKTHGVYIVTKENKEFRIDLLEDEANLSDLGEGVYMKDDTIYIKE